MPQLFGSFFPNLIIWIQGSGAAGHVSSMAYFLNFLEDKERRFKTKLTLSLILRFNLRLGGYSIWSASLIAPRIKEDLQTLGTWAPRSLEEVKEVFGRHFQDEVWKNSKTPSEVLVSHAVLDYEEPGGLSDLGPRDCAHDVHTQG
jgi:hypothetical protein